ncbi:uncharacterized protein BT62DRAFT_929607, partial [Guyanagaster necrorhizus]
MSLFLSAHVPLFPFNVLSYDVHDSLDCRIFEAQLFSEYLSDFQDSHEQNTSNGEKGARIGKRCTFPQLTVA